MTEDELKVVRSTSCPSISGRSTITYEIGGKGDNQFIRLSANSAGGLFCKEWVPLADIQQLLSESPNVTSKALQPLYAGKSANSPGFLLAALVHEKLCSTGKDIVSAPEIPPQKKPAKAKKITAKESE